MSHSSSTSVTVNAPREKVWDAITRPELVKQYFFGTDLETDWQPGSPVFFRGEWEGKPYEDKGTVLSYEPMESLSFNYWSAFSGREDTPETRQIISYELDDAPGGIEVTITQSNVETQEQADHGAKNWKMVLEAMKTLIEA